MKKLISPTVMVALSNLCMLSAGMCLMARQVWGLAISLVAYIALSTIHFAWITRVQAALKEAKRNASQR